jgi:hypothetical protein
MTSARWAWTTSPRVMSALAVFAAVVLFVCLNILARRFYARWDVSGARLYSLSPVTLEVLRTLDAPVEVIVMLAEGDPVTASARQILTTYSAHSRALNVRFVDPDRDHAELKAIASKYQLSSSGSDDAVDTALLFAKGKSVWRVGSDQLMTYDEAAGRVQPLLEQALTSGIRNVMSVERQQVCFTRGHGEASLDGAGTDGLAVFRSSLERNNFEVREIDLAVTGQASALAGCDLVVVGAPRSTVSPAAAELLRAYLTDGGSLLLVLQARLTEQGTVQSHGLQSLLALGDIESGRDVVFEADPELMLPVGIAGEVFLATTRPHEVTRLLADTGQVPHRVLMQMPQAITLGSNSTAVSLLTSSARARRIREPGRLADPQAHGEVLESAATGEQVLAAALQLGPSANKGAARQGRLVLVGSLAPLVDTGFLGSRLFVDGALAWLSNAPPPVNVPEKPAREVSLNLSDESLASVSRYVLAYMPGTALLIGVILLAKRRSREKLSRGSTQEAG